MNTNRLKRFAGLFIALTVATTTAFSGNNPGRNCANRGTCVNQISNLSVEQKEKISSYQVEHKKVMDQLREKCRSTTNLTLKAQTRDEMNSEKQKYQNNIKMSLTPEQQTQFTGSNQSRVKGQANGSCSGNGNRGGKGKGNGRGQGKGQGSRNGSCRQS